MMYFLVSGHRQPKFYNKLGKLVESDLNYVSSKTVRFIDKDGDLLERTLSGSGAVVNGYWMVESVEQSLESLSQIGVYPFIDKASAKEHAKRLGLKTFQYIPVC